MVPHPDHLSIADEDFALNPNLHLTSQTPPTFLLQAEIDHMDNVNDSLAYYIALKNAGVESFLTGIEKLVNRSTHPFHV